MHALPRFLRTFRLRTLLVRTLLVLLCVPVLILLLLGGGLLWLGTASGELWLRDNGLSALNSVLEGTGISCEARSVAGPLPGQLAVAGLVLSDAHGPWFSMDEARVVLELTPLLRGQLLVREISLEAPRLLRVPRLPPSPDTPYNPDPLAFTRDLPSWLPAIRVDRLRVRRLTLPATLLDSTLPNHAAESAVLSFALDGELAVPSAAELSTRLHLWRTDTPADSPDIQTSQTSRTSQISQTAPTDSLLLEATLHPLTQILRLDMRLVESAASLPSSLSSPDVPAMPFPRGLLAGFVPELHGFSLTLHGEAPVTAWNGAFDADAPGLGQVSGTLALNTVSRSVGLDATLVPAPELPAPWPAALAGTRLEAHAAMEDGRVRVPRLSLRVQGMDAALEAVNIEISDAGPGNLRLHGELNAGLRNPAVLAPAFVPSSALKNPLPFAEASATVRLGGTLFTPDVSVQTRVRSLHPIPDSSTPPVDVQADVTLALSSSGQLVLTSTLDASSSPSTLRLALHAEASGQPLQEYAGRGALPAVDSFAAVESLLRRLTASTELSLTAENTAALGIPGLEAPTTTVRGHGKLHWPDVQVRLESPELLAAGQTLTGLQLGLDGNLNVAPLAFRGSLAADTPHGPARLTLEGTVAETSARLRQINTRITAQFAGVQLGGQTRARFADTSPVPLLDGQLAVQVEDWSALTPFLPPGLSVDSTSVEVRLAAGDTVDSQTAEARVSVQNLLLPDAGQFTLSSFEGVLRGSRLFTTPDIDARLTLGSGSVTGALWSGASVRFEGQLSASPALELSAEISGITADTLGNAPPLNLMFTGTLPAGSKALQCELRSEGLGLEPVVARAAVPLLVRGIFPEPDMNGPLSGSVEWKGQLTPLWRLVPVANCRVRGLGAVALQLGGTLGKPRPQGVISLSDVLFQDLGLALELSHMNADARFNADGTAAVQASGDGGRGGSFRFSGSIGAVESGLPLRLSGTFNKVAPLLRRDLRFSLSGDVQVLGTPVNPDLRASLVVDGGELLVENLPGGGVTTLDVEEGDAPPPSPAPALGSLDVSVTVPGRFYVRGHGIESEWKGQINVTGPLTAPVVVGNLNSVRGTFTFLSKLFVLSRGQVVFDGNSPPLPVLDIQVTYTRQDFTALIALTGPATRPRLNLSSRPQMPKDEIVSQILFGRGTGGLARGEALQLGATLASLSLFGTQGGSIVDFTRESLGLDVLRFGSSQGLSGGATSASNFTSFGNTGIGTMNGSGNGGTNGQNSNEDDFSVEAGKYVLDNVYVGVEQGMEADTSGVVVNIEATPHISIEAKATGKGTEVGVRWAWDY